MNKKIIILVAVVVVIISVGILLRGYIKPYSTTGDQNVPANIPDVTTNIPVDISQTNNEINIKNFAFTPAILNTQVGAKVIWKQNDQVIHKIVSNEGLFDSNELKPGDEFSFIFTKAGEYNYYCAIHPSMRGKIIVK